MDDYHYSTKETAQLLGLSVGRIRQMLNADPPELPAKHNETTGAWMIEAHAVNRLRDQRRRQGLLAGRGGSGRGRPPATPPESASGPERNPAGELPAARGVPARENPSERPDNYTPDVLLDLIRDIRQLERERGELTGELSKQRELTQRTESSMSEERRRERANLEAQLEAARQRTQELEAQIERERSRGFWSRLFGGG